MIFEIIFICVLLLFLFFIFLKWNDKKELNKLRRNYDEDGDKSRSGAECVPGRPVSTGCREEIDTILNREPVVKGNVEPKAGRVLPSADAITSNENSGKPRKAEEPGLVL